ncbi:hypothetical protein P886_3051 [Alteromonadaceae bacterium 2753L.S.0a.02]|nr:hypothetical protein P886_3051 [Alteromonadaceae bacterium 2753L.S.0a.02]
MEKAIFTVHAEGSLEGLLQYTASEWGQNQALKYLAEVKMRLNTLAHRIQIQLQIRMSY